MTPEYKWIWGQWEVWLQPSATTAYAGSSTEYEDDAESSAINMVELKAEFEGDYPIGYCNHTAKIKIDLKKVSDTIATHIAYPFETQTVTVTGTAPVDDWDITFDHGNLWAIVHDSNILFMGCQIHGIEGGFDGSEIEIELDSIYKIIGENIKTEGLLNYWSELTEELPRVSFGAIGDRSYAFRNLGTYSYYIQSPRAWMGLLTGFASYVNSIATDMYEKIARVSVASNTFAMVNTNMLPDFYEQVDDGTGDVGSSESLLYLIMRVVDKGISDKATATPLGGGFLWVLKTHYDNIYDFMVDLSEASITRTYVKYDETTGIGLFYEYVKDSTYTYDTSNTNLLDFKASPMHGIMTEVQAVPMDLVSNSINKFTTLKTNGNRNGKGYNVNISLTNTPIVFDRGHNHKEVSYVQGFELFYKISTVWARVHEYMSKDITSTTTTDDYYTFTAIPRESTGVSANPCYAFKQSVLAGWPKIAAETIKGIFSGDYQTQVEIKIDPEDIGSNLYKWFQAPSFLLDLDDYNETGHATLFSSYPTEYFPSEVTLTIEEGKVEMEATALG